jgi:hypothetical protein
MNDKHVKQQECQPLDREGHRAAQLLTGGSLTPAKAESFVCSRCGTRIKLIGELNADIVKQRAHIVKLEGKLDDAAEALAKAGLGKANG